MIASERLLLEGTALRKATLRIIPFLFILYLGAYLDRINLSFAAKEFKADLHFSETVYGAGAGIFFLGYFLFEIPSNLMLERSGARLWIARIMISWAIISSLMMFVHTPFSFYLVRFLLGVAEAGFFPGMIFYLTVWFPKRERARAVSRFMTAVPTAAVIGAPLSTAIMKYMPLLVAHTSLARHHLHGWQWLFLLEGVPSFVLGFIVLFYLTDRPEIAHWLLPGEKQALIERLDRERTATEQRRHYTLLQAFTNPQVLILTGIYFCLQVGGYGFTLWLPEILKGFKSISSAQGNLLTIIPYSVAAVGMISVGQHSDRTGERKGHVALSCFISALGMGASAFLHLPALALVALSVAAFGLWGYLGPFWSLPTSFLTGAAAAGGIAFINSFGNLGGFLGPYLMGVFKDRLHNFTAGLLTLAGSILLAGLLTLTLHRSVDTAPEEVIAEDTYPFSAR